MDKDEEIKIESSKFKIIISYFAILLLGSLAIYLIVLGITKKEIYNFKYDESNNVDYKVYLNENDYFEEPFLPSDRKYISSLIDNITVDFDYKLSSLDEMKGNYTYAIVARLEAKERGKDIVIWNKDETLWESEENTLNNSNTIEIHKQEKIDYNKYNMIINDFRKANGLSIQGELIVSLVVNSDLNIDVSDKVISNKNKSSIRIPLMETTIAIDKNYKESNNVNYPIEKKANILIRAILVIMGIILLIPALIYLRVLVKESIIAYKNRDKYNQALKKIFRDYDSIIVESQDHPNLESKRILNVKDFNEILDAQMSLQEPIVYYYSKRKNQSYFYVIKDERVFKYILSPNDFIDNDGDNHEQKTEV